MTTKETREALSARLRKAVADIRRKPFPISDLIPLLTESADALDSPAPDDHQAKDAALLELCGKWNAGELSDTDFAYAIDAAIEAQKGGT